MQDSVLPRPAALLEREHELDRVRTAVRAAGRREGGVLVIEGAAEMGKSQLLGEARRFASEHGLRVLSARATELEQGFPFATRPLDPALTPHAAALVADPAAEVLQPAALSRAAIGALVSARLSADVDDRFLRACLEVTGGNPFLVNELLSE